MRVKPSPERGCLFYFLACLCSLLTVFCVCLIVTIVLLSNHFQHDTAVADGRQVNPSVLDHRIQSDEAAQLVVDMPSAATPVKREEWETQYRLPTDSIPLHYDLLLNPDLNNGTFRGEVAITLHIVNRRSFIAVNTKKLDIYETQLVKLTERNSSDGEEVALRNAFEYKPNEFWIVRISDSKGIAPGFYKLHLKFNGQLTDKIVGFYRSVYTNPNTNVKRQIATSKFQPTYARQAFPCFDEPSFKSSFTVHLVRPSHGYSALSNMDQVGEVEDLPEVGQTTVEFRTSVAMVTYLACFIVSDFERLAPITISQGFPFSVYAPPHQVAKTKYSLQLGAAITEYYINYFSIPYPLPKLDMIAIPDFPSGAMEHWGLITFREVNLLYDAKESSTANQHRVAYVIAHELAHMWFGNLVTLKWWDDLWLNEGFASYMEYKAVNHVHPNWAVMDQFLVDDLHKVLSLDAALSSHPIVQTVGHPDEITELFDAISYSKGASIIRMLEDFLGEEKFRQSISRFLNKFKFANAVTQDLWDTLQEAAGDINITHVMDTWTRQMGFPVVTVTRNGMGWRVLKQQRFLADPEAKTTGVDSPYGYKWEIPITYVTSNSSEVEHLWLNSHASSVELNIASDVEWVKFNHRQVGYYRVNYNKEDWTALSSLLVTSVNSLESSDRAHLLEDAFSLAEAGLLDYQIALDMTRYLNNELDYVPWKVATSKFATMLNLLSSTAVYPKLRKYIRKLIENIYSEVTWTASDTNNHLKKQLRVIVMGQACSVGLSWCVKEASTLFSTWIEEPDQVFKAPPDMRSNIYHYGMFEVGGEKEWDQMWQLYLTESDAQEKSKLLYGLAAVSEPWLLRRYIELAKNESFVRSQDFFIVLRCISDNPVGNPIVWEFIRSEWLYLVNRFTLNDRVLGRCIPYITQYFSSEFKLQEMQAFFDHYPDAGAGKTARTQALETVANNIKWLQKHEAVLDQWLTQANST